MSEVVIRVVVEQRPAPAPSGAAAWAPKGGRRAVTPAPKYGLGKVLYYKPAFRYMRMDAKFVVEEIRIRAMCGVVYCDRHGNEHRECDVEANMDAACRRWKAKDLPVKGGGI